MLTASEPMKNRTTTEPAPMNAAGSKPDSERAPGDDDADHSTNRSDTATDSSSNSVNVTGRLRSSSSGSSNNTTPPEAREPGGDGEGAGGGDRSEGSSSDADVDLHLPPGALTPAILSLLQIQPTTVCSTHAVDELSADLHGAAAAAVAVPPATRSMLHALSKESLDVLRAERIARRMAREAAAPAAPDADEGSTARAKSPLIARAVNDVTFDVDGNGSPSTTKRKAKSARATRVYLPIVHSAQAAARTSAAKRGEEPLRVQCEFAPVEAA